MKNQFCSFSIEEQIAWKLEDHKQQQTAIPCNVIKTSWLGYKKEKKRPKVKTTSVVYMLSTVLLNKILGRNK